MARVWALDPYIDLIRDFQRSLERRYRDVAGANVYGPRDDRGDCIDLVVRLNGHPDRTFRILDDEVRMEGERAVLRWIEVIDRDIWELVGRYRSPRAIEDRPMTATEVMYRQQQAFTQVNALDRRILEGLNEAFNAALRPENKAANDKAAALFKQTAGTDAFTALEAGNGWPITGSKGTAYRLFKRSSYCVTRVSDGAKLCAVVPGVPLYDHLLGIKLMVEQDEEKFIKTANVAVTATAPGPWGDGLWRDPPRILGMDWAQ